MIGGGPYRARYVPDSLGKADYVQGAVLGTLVRAGGIVSTDLWCAPPSFLRLLPPVLLLFGEANAGEPRPNGLFQP